jgi:hypothetical protein
MMKAIITSETTVNFYETVRRNKPEDSHILQDLRIGIKYAFLIIVSQYPERSYVSK